jgi:hypothetical protein
MNQSVVFCLLKTFIQINFFNKLSWIHCSFICSRDCWPSLQLTENELRGQRGEERESKMRGEETEEGEREGRGGESDLGIGAICLS